jgi:hypothetical protein
MKMKDNIELSRFQMLDGGCVLCQLLICTVVIRLVEQGLSFFALDMDFPLAFIHSDLCKRNFFLFSMHLYSRKDMCDGLRNLCSQCKSHHFLRLTGSGHKGGPTGRKCFFRGSSVKSIYFIFCSLVVRPLNQLKELPHVRFIAGSRPCVRID